MHVSHWSDSWSSAVKTGSQDVRKTRSSFEAMTVHALLQAQCCEISHMSQIATGVSSSTMGYRSELR